MLLRKRKILHEDDVKMLRSSRRTQPPVNCLWFLVSSFPGLSVNSDNLPFSYVILFLYSLICHYMHENWSWHAYRFALGFLWKNRCDMEWSESPETRGIWGPMVSCEWYEHPGAKGLTQKGSRRGCDWRWCAEGARWKTQCAHWS
jgi:hypothetical protein